MFNRYLTCYTVISYIIYKNLQYTFYNFLRQLIQGETDLSDLPSFFQMFPLLLKEPINKSFICIWDPDCPL